MNRYVVSDLHGQLDLYNQIMSYVAEDDIIYALGDFGDRGPYPWETLKAALDNPQIVYIMGNHDLMLLDAIEFVLKEEAAYGSCNIYSLHYFNVDELTVLELNGGLPTLEGWMKDPARMKYYEKLKRLPLEIKLMTLDRCHIIYLSHAGYTPWVNSDVTIGDLVWGRTHFYGGIPSDGDLVIHGHTPISYLTRRLPRNEYDTTKGYCSYCKGSKIDIDMGAHYTNQTVLLNLDTLESEIFSTEGEDECTE